MIWMLGAGLEILVTIIPVMRQIIIRMRENQQDARTLAQIYLFAVVQIKSFAMHPINANPKNKMGDHALKTQNDREITACIISVVQHRLIAGITTAMQGRI